METQFWIIIAFAIYCTGNFIFSLCLYKKYRLYKNEKLIFDEKTNETKNLHDLYPEFRRYDDISFIRIFLGLVLFVWIKILIAVIIVLNLSLWLK